MSRLQVPEYADMARPKHHFARHLPVDILNSGPPRGYWCVPTAIARLLPCAYLPHCTGASPMKA